MRKLKSLCLLFQEENTKNLEISKDLIITLDEFANIFKFPKKIISLLNKSDKSSIVTECNLEKTKENDIEMLKNHNEVLTKIVLKFVILIIKSRKLK